MSKTGLQGPYPLSFDAIDSVVRATSAGVYALGHTDAQGRFAINHVGRSDSDLRARLLDCIGSEKLFKYGYSASAQTVLREGVPAVPRLQSARQPAAPGPAEGHYVELSSLPDVCVCGVRSAMTSARAAW
jgi:hypothetical protein